MKQKSESGQALVLVLLSLSVVLTLVLFILSRSVTDVAVSSRQEESVRAFSAAEAGIERSLVTGAYSADVSIGYTAKVTSLAEGLAEFAYPFDLSSGDSATIWFRGHDINGNLTTAGAFTGSGMTVCWGNSGTSNNLPSTPAVEVSVYYEANPGHFDSIRIARAAFDPSPGRAPFNSFDPLPGSGTCPVSRSYQFKKTIVFPTFSPPVNTGGLLFARIKMFYNGATPHGVGVRVIGDVLPSQGQRIDSNGVAGVSNRRIVVLRGWAEFPFVSNALFIPPGIMQ